MASQVERITLVVIEVELNSYDDAGEICERRAEKFHAIESKIPKDVRTWMLGLIPAKRKEG